MDDRECHRPGLFSIPGILLGAAAIAIVAYLKLIAPWHRRWGATDDEVARSMPLDDRVAEPTQVSTRAVTIEATAAEIWPWIVQMGETPRAGYYSYVLVERAQGMDVANSDRILEEFQTLNLGDALDKGGNMTVLAVEPQRYLVLGPPPLDYLQCTWAFELIPFDAGKTRLVTRVRAHADLLGMLRATPPLMWPFWLLIDPGVFVMERKMLIEIKRRAERLHQAPPARI